MLKTIARQPVLFSPLPVADVRNSITLREEMSLLERLWNKIRDFFRDSDKQKAFKSIEKYLKTESDLNYNSPSAPATDFDIDLKSDLDSYLNLNFLHLSPEQKQTSLCCFWNKIASKLPEPHCNTFKQDITFSEEQDGTLVMHGAIFILNEKVNDYSIRIEKDQNGKSDFSGLYLAHSNISHMNMVNCNFSNVSFEHSTFVNVEFKAANFTNTNFGHSYFIDTDFTTENCTNANFEYAQFLNVRFSGANCTNANFKCSHFMDSDISNAICAHTNFYHTQLNNVVFKESNCTDANFEQSKLSKINFIGSNCTNANFKFSLFSDSDISNAICAHTNFYHTQLNNVAFEESNCSDTSFNRCIFKRCNFKKTNCTGANFDFAMIYGVESKNHYSKGNYTKGMILTDSSCINTTLIRADLSESNCQNANFTRAKLSSSILPSSDMMKGTTLYLADLCDTTLIEEVEETAAEAEKPAHSTLSKIILQYLRSDKNPESLIFDKQAAVTKVKLDICNFIITNQYSDRIFTGAKSHEETINKDKYDSLVKAIKEQARKQFIAQYTPQKNELLRSGKLTPELMAKYKMLVQMKQLIINTETQSEIKIHIKEDIDAFSESLFDTVHQTIADNFDVLFQQDLDNMRKYYV